MAKLNYPKTENELETFRIKLCDIIGSSDYTFDDIIAMVAVQPRLGGHIQSLNMRIEELEKQFSLKRRYDGDIQRLQSQLDDLQSLVAIRR